jgi:hypothetical protein
MKLSMTGHEKGDLLTQVTTWAGLTVYYFRTFNVFYKLKMSKCRVRFDNVIVLNVFVYRRMNAY